MSGLRRVLTLGALVASVGCSDGSEVSSKTIGIHVEGVIARPEPLMRTLRFTGTLFAEKEMVIGAKVAGRVKEVLHDLRDVVSVGQALLRIDETDYVLARTSRLEAAREALARLGLSKLPKTELDFSSLPSVERARLNAQNSNSRYARAKKLFERTPPLMSEQEFSNVKTEWEVAKNDHALAILNARALLAQASTLQAQYEQSDQVVRDTLHEVPSGTRPPLTKDSAPESMDGRYYVARREVSVGD